MQERPSEKSELARLQFLLASVVDGTWEWDIATNRVLWSDAACQLLGLSPGAVAPTFDDLQNLVHPQDLQSFQTVVDAHLSTGQPYDIEMRLRRADGRYVWVLDRGGALYDGDGRPYCMLGALADITARKANEAILYASQRRFATLTESAPVGIFRTDSAGICLYVNDRWCEIAGLTPATALGLNWSQSLHPEDGPRVRERWEAAVREQCWFAEEYRLRRPDGRITWVFGQAVAERAGSGAVVGYIGTITDVSIRKETEAALRQSRQILRQVIDNIPQVITWKDRNLTYLGCNQQAAALVRMTPKTIIGKRDRDLPWANGHAEWLQHCDRRAIETGEPELHAIETQPQANGKQVWFDTNRIPLRDGEGKITGLLVTLEDITERLTADRRLQSFSASLRHLHRLSTRNFQDFTELFKAYLQAGCEMLDLPTGMLTRLASHNTLVLDFVRSGPGEEFVPGARLPLQDTVCKLAIQQQGTVAMESCRNVPVVCDLAPVRKQKIDCYLTTPIWVDREIYGTLCFIAPTARPVAFEAYECEIVEVMARDLGRFVAAQRSERQRLEAEAALRRSEAKYRSIFENISQGIFQTTPDGRYLSVNPFLAQLLGYDSPEDLTAAVTDISNIYAEPQQRDRLAQETERLGAVRDFESRVYRRDGSAIWIAENQHAVRADDGTLLYYEGTVEDITARRLAEERLQHDAFHDKLTGLHNRAWFTRQLRDEIAAYDRSQQLYSVLFVDLDRFKVINDSLGHLVGDDLLVRVAQRLASATRSGDTLARFGGDEFAILLRHLQTGEEAAEIAARLNGLLQQPIRLGNRDFSIGASVGIALGSRGYCCVEDVLRDADLAMYQAKANGGSGHAVFEEAMLPQAMTRLQLEHDLQRAIELDELRLHYQPIYALQSGQLCGFEALVRWQHHQKGWIGPADFIPIAEETGTIDAIGGWVLEASFRQLQQWRRRFAAVAEPLQLHVNVSGLQLKQPDFAARVSRLLQTLELPGNAIEIEITETSFFETAGIDPQALVELRRLGCKLCIDDFGTGYSSLSRLHALCVDTIKIDRGFVDGIEVDATKAAIARTIVTLARDLGAKTVSEGIETTAQCQKLQELGCSFGQGFLYARPLAAKAIESLLQDRLSP